MILYIVVFLWFDLLILMELMKAQGFSDERDLLGSRAPLERDQQETIYSGGTALQQMRWMACSSLHKNPLGVHTFGQPCKVAAQMYTRKAPKSCIVALASTWGSVTDLRKVWQCQIHLS